MGKIDTRALARAARPVFSEKFTDPGQPGVELELRIRRIAPGSVLDLWRVDATEAMVRQYVTGLVDADGAPVLGKDRQPLQPPADFVMFDGPWLPAGSLSRLACAAACRLAALEMAGDKPAEDRYDAEDFVRISETMPAAWEALCGWVNRIVDDAPAGGEGEPGEAPGAGEKPAG